LLQVHTLCAPYHRYFQIDALIAVSVNGIVIDVSWFITWVPRPGLGRTTGRWKPVPRHPEKNAIFDSMTPEWTKRLRFIDAKASLRYVTKVEEK